MPIAAEVTYSKEPCTSSRTNRTCAVYQPTELDFKINNNRSDRTGTNFQFHDVMETFSTPGNSLEMKTSNRINLLCVECRHIRYIQNQYVHDVQSTQSYIGSTHLANRWQSFLLTSKTHTKTLGFIGTKINIKLFFGT